MPIKDVLSSYERSTSGDMAFELAKARRLRPMLSEGTAWSLTAVREGTSAHIGNRIGTFVVAALGPRAEFPISELMGLERPSKDLVDDHEAADSANNLHVAILPLTKLVTHPNRGVVDQPFNAYVGLTHPNSTTTDLASIEGVGNHPNLPPNDAKKLLVELDQSRYNDVVINPREDTVEVVGVLLTQNAGVLQAIRNGLQHGSFAEYQQAMNATANTRPIDT